MDAAKSIVHPMRMFSKVACVTISARLIKRHDASSSRKRLHSLSGTAQRTQRDIGLQYVTRFHQLFIQMLCLQAGDVINFREQRKQACR